MYAIYDQEHDVFEWVKLVPFSETGTLEEAQSRWRNLPSAEKPSRVIVRLTVIN